MSNFVSKDWLLCLLFSDAFIEIENGITELRSLELQSIQTVFRRICLEMPTSLAAWYVQLGNQSFLSLHLLVLMHEYQVEWVRDLTVLDLRNRGLEHLPYTFQQLSQLTLIRLEGNPLDYIPQGLACISLDDSQLYLLEAWEHEGYSGTEVHLTYMDSDCAEAPSLKNQIIKLDISHNGLNEVPDWVKHMTALRELDVSYNRLSVLPWGIGNLTRLTELNVCRTGLRTFPPTIKHLTQLQGLFVFDTALTSLPDTLGDLNLLEVLDVSFTCELESIVPAVLSMKNLKELQAAFHPLMPLLHENDIALKCISQELRGQGS